MVEHFNRSILQMLSDQEDNWEHYLPLVLYAYRAAQHSSTGVYISISANVWPPATFLTI